MHLLLMIMYWIIYKVCSQAIHIWSHMFDIHYYIYTILLKQEREILAMNYLQIIGAFVSKFHSLYYICISFCLPCALLSQKTPSLMDKVLNFRAIEKKKFKSYFSFSNFIPILFCVFYILKLFLLVIEVYVKVCFRYNLIFVLH